MSITLRIARNTPVSEAVSPATAIVVATQRHGATPPTRVPSTARSWQTLGAERATGAKIAP